MFRVTWRFEEHFARELWPENVPELQALLDGLEPITTVGPIFLAASDAMQARLRAWGAESQPSLMPVELRSFYDVWFSKAELALEGARRIAGDLRVNRSAVEVSTRPAARFTGAGPGTGTPVRRTPPLDDRQGYLAPPPGGVGAAAAWQLPGGKGDGTHSRRVDGRFACLPRNELPREGLPRDCGAFDRCR